MPAAIPAVAGLLGGGISALSQRSANKAQERANQAALAEERRREGVGEARRKEAMDVYRNNWQAWFQRYGKKGIDRYGMPAGIDVTKLRAPGSPAAPPTPAGVGAGGLIMRRGPGGGPLGLRRGPGGPLPGPAVMAGAGGPGMTLGDMISRAGTAVGAVVGQRKAVRPGMKDLMVNPIAKNPF